MKPKVLCVEDDSTMQVLIAKSLSDCEVILVKTLREAQEFLASSEIDALLVDIELPDGDGLRFLADVCQSERFQNTPALIISGHAVVANKVMAFNFGAEDFITKPFDPFELHSRVLSKIRRRQREKYESKKRKIGNLLLDTDRQKAFRIEQNKEKDLQLTGIELRILTLLTQRLEQVFSREQILNSIWGDTYISDRTVDSHIAHLRQKLSETEVTIETVKNMGYRASVKKQ